LPYYVNFDLFKFQIALTKLMPKGYSMRISVKMAGKEGLLVNWLIGLLVHLLIVDNS
jgi:hypothetical protein